MRPSEDDCTAYAASRIRTIASSFEFFPRTILSDYPNIVYGLLSVERANEKLARVEQIKRYKLLATDWEAGGDELTPTMKLKRKEIAQKYADEIAALYSG